MPTQNTWNNTIDAAAVTLNGGVTSIGTDAAANAINIGTGGAAKTITIGNVIGATAVQINAGSGASAINTTNAPFTLNTGTGTIGLGGDAVAKAISVGNTTGASNLTLKCGTSGCSVVSATGNIIVAAAAGQVTMPIQPAFFAYLSGTRSNVTGDSTTYTVVWGSSIFNRGTNFDGTSTFTAPVTGIYAFSAQCFLQGILAGHTGCFMQITTSNREYFSNAWNPATVSAGGAMYTSSSIIADMDAGDTAVVKITVQNSTKVISVSQVNAGDPRSWFQGHLIC